METKDIIQYSKVQYKPICFQVDCVKDFILFNIIYDETSGNDQKERFKNALSKLDEIKDSILDNISAKLIYEIAIYIISKYFILKEVKVVIAKYTVRNITDNVNAYMLILNRAL